MNYNCYFKFLRFSLGLYEGDEFLPGEALKGFDWNGLYRFAQKQTLVGVIFEGIQKLPKEVAPTPDMLMAWLGQYERIRKNNLRLNEATARIYNQIKAEGYRCCILKGQGNALMYPNPASRAPGDVDVWVNAGRDEIRQLACTLSKDGGTVDGDSFNHAQLTMNGVAVELHSTPAVMSNPLYHHRMQKWLRRNSDLQCSNIVSLPDGAGEIAVPTAAFNVVYQLYHLYHHLFDEGVGLRQVVDYYFVIRSLPQISQINTDFSFSKTNKDNLPQISQMTQMFRLFGEGASNTDCTDRAALQFELKRLGLWKFAGAVMWVLHEVLGLPSSHMIAPMDEKRGKLLLDEILSGGNFGQYSSQQHFGRGTLGHNVQRLRRDWRLVRYYPAEALAEPFFRVWHFLWRFSHK